MFQIMPTNSLHSTSPEELLEQNLEVLNFLYEVKNKIYESSPHSRDYKDFEDMRCATNEHVDNLKCVEKLIKYYTNKSEHINEFLK